MHVAKVCLLVLTYTAPSDCDFGESHMGCLLEALFSRMALVLCRMNARKVIYMHVFIPHSLWLSPHAVPGSFRNKIIIVGDL